MLSARPTRLAQSLIVKRTGVWPVPTLWNCRTEVQDGIKIRRGGKVNKRIAIGR